MRARTALSTLFAHAIALAIVALPSFASAQSLTTFTVPGSVHTRAFGITPSGDVVGIYVNADNTFHGFLLTPIGFTFIDYPGALVTSASKINPRGDIAGYYGYAIGQYHGFLLHHDAFITFDFPGATFTAAASINARGDIVGAYQNADLKFHGFVLSGGEFASIDYPGAVLTQANDINADGDILGVYQDPDATFHMFLCSKGRTPPWTCREPRRLVRRASPSASTRKARSSVSIATVAASRTAFFVTGRATRRSTFLEQPSPLQRRSIHGGTSLVGTAAATEEMSPIF